MRAPVEILRRIKRRIFGTREEWDRGIAALHGVDLDRLKESESDDAKRNR